MFKLLCFCVFAGNEDNYGDGIMTVGLVLFVVAAVGVVVMFCLGLIRHCLVGDAAEPTADTSQGRNRRASETHVLNTQISSTQYTILPRSSGGSWAEQAGQCLPMQPSPWAVADTNAERLQSTLSALAVSDAPLIGHPVDSLESDLSGEIQMAAEGIETGWGRQLEGGSTSAGAQWTLFRERSTAIPELFICPITQVRHSNS